MIKKDERFLDFRHDLIEKYNYPGPRYTSYPTALEFKENFVESDYLNALNQFPERSLSLYVHIPFCHKLCYFCACNKIITRHHEKSDEYLDYLEKEIRHRASFLKNRIVTQLHFGGGTPTFLNEKQISFLMKLLRENFNFDENAEISLEIDPREIEISILDHLKKEGFNRISIGIQDFNKEIQIAINRNQDEIFIAQLIRRAKELHFSSINLDLIYGLPKQTNESFLFTLQKVLELDPDRLSIFNYAHLPDRFPAQRKIKNEDLPKPEERLKILISTIQFLIKNNFHYIGMDHFAKANDELTIAQKEGKLHRNFQGYTTQNETDLVGFGVSAISIIGNAYAQNEKELNHYYTKINEQNNAIAKGLTMTNDDVIRADLIRNLICNLTLNFNEFEKKYNIKSKEYFAKDFDLLKKLEEDRLVKWHKNTLQVTEQGRLLVRYVCMCFDVYFREKLNQRNFSRVI